MKSSDNTFKYFYSILYSSRLQFCFCTSSIYLVLLDCSISKEYFYTMLLDSQCYSLTDSLDALFIRTTISNLSFSNISLNPEVISWILVDSSKWPEEKTV